MVTISRRGLLLSAGADRKFFLDQPSYLSGSFGSAGGGFHHLNLKSIVDQFQAKLQVRGHLLPLHKIDHLVYPAVDLPVIVAEAADSQMGFLPKLLVAHLSDGDVKTVSHFILEALDDCRYLSENGTRAAEDYFRTPMTIVFQSLK
jgi:hypothetical protein